MLHVWSRYLLVSQFTHISFNAVLSVVSIIAEEPLQNGCIESDKASAHKLRSCLLMCHIVTYDNSLIIA
jgi:hypothetical protein